MRFIARMFMLCFVLSITGNLYARPHSPHPPKKHKYYYYPRQNVYYDPADNVYFVWERTYWKPVPHPTGGFVSVAYSNSPRFELLIASNRPYYYNVEHRRTYHEYRVVKPAPHQQARVRVESRPKPNVSFHLEINSEPQPVYVEERVIVVKERPHHGPPHNHGHGHGNGHGHGHGKGHRH